MSVYLVLLGIAVAWVLAYVVLKYVFSRDVEKGENVSLYPLFIMLKAKRVTGPLDRIANKFPAFWDAISRIAIVTGVGMAALAVFVLVNNLLTYLFRPETVGPQNIVIPLIIGVTIKLEHIPYLLIALGIVLITHEGMHGIIARREGLPVKSAGVFLLFILPGGFVEPDEQAFRNAHPNARIRVAAVGSFANLIVGIIAVFLVLGLFASTEQGLLVSEVSEDSKIPVGEVIVSVEGVPVNSYTVRFKNITLGETITVTGLKGEYTYQVREEFIGSEFPLGTLIRSLGIERVDYYFPLRFMEADPNAVYTLYRTLSWLQLVSIGVAIFNMLPIHMLDGSIILRSFLERYTRDGRKINGAALAATAACLGLLASNIIFTYNTFGFFQL